MRRSFCQGAGKPSLEVAAPLPALRYRLPDRRAHGPVALAVPACAILALVAAFAVVAVQPALAASRAPVAASVPESAYADLRWRLLGPFRGGWATAVAGIPGDPATFFFGGADGGVWKTTDAGVTWRPIFERDRSSSIGALAIAPSDPQVIWIGTGQVHQRWDVVSGEGALPLDRRRRYVEAGGARRQPAHRQDLGRSEGTPTSPSSPRSGTSSDRAASAGSSAREDGGRSWTRVLYPRRRHRSGRDRRRSGASGAALRGALAGAAPPLVGLLPADRRARHRRLPLGRRRAHLDRRRTLRLARGRPRADRPCRGSGERRASRSGRRSPARGSSRSADGGATWTLANADGSLANSYMANLAVDPRDSGDALGDGAGPAQVERRRQELHDRQGSAGRRRLPHPLDRSARQPAHDHRRRSGGGRDPERRRLVEQLVQPADGTVLSPRRRPPLPLLDLQRSAGQRHGGHRQPQRLRPAHLPRLASGRRRRARRRHPRSGESRHRLRRRPRRPPVEVERAHRRGAERLAVAGRLPTARAPAATRYRYSWITPVAISPRPPHAIYQGAQVLFRSLDGGASWSTVSPDLTGAVPGASGCEGDVPVERATACGFGVIFAIAPSPAADGAGLDRHRQRPRAAHPRRRRDLEGRHPAGNWRVEQGEHRSMPRRAIRRRPTSPPIAIASTRCGRSPSAPTTSAPPGPTSPAACRRTSGWARCARIRSGRACSTPARTAASMSRSTTATTWQRLQLNLPTTGINDLLVARGRPHRRHPGPRDLGARRRRAAAPSRRAAIGRRADAPAAGHRGAPALQPEQGHAAAAGGAAGREPADRRRARLSPAGRRHGSRS